MKRAQAWFLPLAAGALLIGLWYLVKRLTHLESYLLPSPGEIARAAWRERATLADSVLITGQGAVLGFLAATLGGFLLALILGLAAPLRWALYPYVLILQMTPVIILAPIFVLWLGQGTPSIVAITFMICFFPVVANTTLGFASVDANLRELFAMSGASRGQELLHLRIPAALPYFLTGTKIAGTLAPIGAITGDFLAGTAANGRSGLGFMTITYFSQLKIPELFAAGGVACLLGFLFVGGVNLLYWGLLRRWHESARARE
ncbi:MAG TPA: ABC transporter permease [Opitutaceae bacterium]|nr:ABC transporter permease [Opitutaceae bacterium]